MLRARDLAYLAAVADSGPSGYPRKQVVIGEIQRLWKACRTMKTGTVTLHVRTSWAEEKMKKRAEEKN